MTPISSVIKKFVHNFMTFMKEKLCNPKRIPKNLVELDTYDSGRFNWHDFYMFYMRCLDAPNEVPIDQEFVDDHENCSAGNRYQFIKKKATEVELRYAIENCLQHRRKIRFSIEDSLQYKRKMSNDK